MGDDDDIEGIGMGRIPVMPTLVMLQQMRNRLHLACLGRKLMKWSAMATGKELRKVSSDLVNIYDGLFEDISTAYIMLARCRFYKSDINTVVLEDPQKQASFNLQRSTKITAGVRYFEYQCIEAEPAPAAYPFLGIGAGGQQYTDTKKYWAALLKRLVMCLELRAAFHALDLANNNATKKIVVLSKIVIPKTLSTLAHALAQLEKNEIENYFKLKNEIQEFMKNQLVDSKENKTVPVSASKTPELMLHDEATKEKTNAAIPPNPLATHAPTKSQEMETIQIPKISFCTNCLNPIPSQPEVPRVPPEIIPYIPSPEPEMEIKQKPKLYISENSFKVVQPKPEEKFAPIKRTMPSPEPEAYVPQTYGKHFKIFAPNLEAKLSSIKKTVSSPESEPKIAKQIKFPTSENCTFDIPPKPEESLTSKNLSSESKLKMLNSTETSTCESSLSSFSLTPEVDRSTISTGDIREIETEITTYTTTVRSINFDGTMSESKKVVEVIREIKMPYQGDMYATGHTSSQFTNHTGKRRGRASKSQAPFHIDEPNVEHFYVPSKSRLFRGYSESLSCVLENESSEGNNENKEAASSSLPNSVQDVEVNEIYADNENTLDDWAESEFKILREMSDEK